MKDRITLLGNSLLILAAIFVALNISHAHAMSANKTSVDDYAGNHNQKNIRMSVGSKAFTWLSGSPADNEKLAIGKSAQFFGFVALRYESERKAHRGNLGRAFYQLATPEQRQIVVDKATLSVPQLELWWQAREQILRQLEQHLYSGEAFNEKQLTGLAEQFGLANAQAALYEGQACAEIEKTLTKAQQTQLTAWRENPDLVNQQKSKGKKNAVTLTHLPKEFANQHQAIFAKCFAYLTGTFEDRQVVPLGQPAQFFGFVSLRQKSGRGAKRGKVSREFYQLLNSEQVDVMEALTDELISLTASFMLLRDQLMAEMDRQRAGAAKTFSLKKYQNLAKQLGVLEVKIGTLEASAYRQVRVSLSEQQQASLMALRGNYIVNEKITQKLTDAQRGKQLYNLCAGCHDAGSQVAPHLDNIIDRSIAATSYNYSQALRALQGKKWSVEFLDKFLAAPREVIPGTSMEFTGLLNEQDRKALIEYVKNNN